MESVSKILSENLQTSIVLIPFNQKHSVLEKLNNENLEIDRIIKFNKDLGQEIDSLTALSQIEAINVFKENLGELKTESEVLYFAIG